MSYLFRVPTTAGPRSRKDWFTQRIVGIPQGQAVLKLAGTWTLAPGANQEDIANAEDSYLGGRDHIVDDATAADLTADGFGAYLTEIT